MEHSHSDDSEHRPVVPWKAHLGDDRDGRMYDDSVRSRSPGGKNFSPQNSGASAPSTFCSIHNPQVEVELRLTAVDCRDVKDRPRSPPPWSADRRDERPGNQGARPQYRSRERDEHRRQRSRSPPRRDGQGYRDRDRVGYRSPSPHHSQPRFGKESKEVMMDGLPLDMGEDDVSRPMGMTGLGPLRAVCS